MADNKRKSYPTMMSPRGIASWPKLNKPDEKYDKFTVGLILEKDVAEKFLGTLKEIDETNLKEAQASIKGKTHPKTGEPLSVEHQGLPYKLELDSNKQPTGRIIVQFGLNATWKDKEDKTQHNKVNLFDASGKPCNVQVGGGSEIIVAFRPSPYFIDGTRAAGVTLKIQAVQVINLRQFGVVEFAPVEGGFQASEDSQYSGIDFASKINQGEEASVPSNNTAKF